MFQQIEYLQSVGSTNDYLKRLVDQGIPRIVVAQEQTSGKGRYGRSWYSPAGEGLYISYLLYPGWDIECASFLNMISILAIRSAILQLGRGSLDPKLKPPNDILIRGRKVGGVLVELGSLNHRITWAVIGIGVNLNHTVFPEDLTGKATSLALEGVSVNHPLDFCEELTKELEHLYRRLEAGEWEEIRLGFEKDSMQ